MNKTQEKKKASDALGAIWEIMRINSTNSDNYKLAEKAWDLLAPPSVPKPKKIEVVDK